MTKGMIHPLSIRISGSLLGKEDYVDIKKRYIDTDEKGKDIIHISMRNSFVTAIHNKFKRRNRYDQFTKSMDRLIDTYVEEYDRTPSHMRNIFIGQLFEEGELNVYWKYEEPIPYDT